MQNSESRKHRLKLGMALGILGFAGSLAPASAYTEEQAVTGRSQYTAQCAMCHGAQLEGGDAPGLTEDTMHNFNTVEGLFDMISVTMPPQMPGELGDQVYIDIIAYLLDFNGAVPDGDMLTPDPVVMANINLMDEITAGRLAGGGDAPEPEVAPSGLPQAFTWGQQLPGSEPVQTEPALPQAFTFGQDLPTVE
ncbi:MAG: cytochrome c [Paracoccaceae bacterium]